MRLLWLQKLKLAMAADCAIACALTGAAGLVLANSVTTEQIRAQADSVQQAFPAGSIQSVERAEAAVRQAQSASLRVEWLGYDLEVACYQRFFVQACLNEARASVRASLHKLRALEIEAEQFKRYERDQKNELERQRKISEAEREAMALSQEYEQRQREFSERQARVQREQEGQQAREAERAAAAEKERVRRSARASELAAKQRAESESAPQRLENVRAFEQKQKEAVERQKKLLEKKKSGA
jgi:colicin import membrane protein